MLTEFEVRRRMADIATSEDPALTKVRRLLRLGQRLRTQAASLEGAKRFSTLARDQNARAHWERMTAKAKLLQEDLREEARGTLSALSKN